MSRQISLRLLRFDGNTMLRIIYTCHVVLNLPICARDTLSVYPTVTVIRFPAVLCNLMYDVKRFKILQRFSRQTTTLL